MSLMDLSVSLYVYSIVHSNWNTAAQKFFWCNVVGMCYGASRNQKIFLTFDFGFDFECYLTL